LGVFGVLGVLGVFGVLGVLGVFGVLGVLGVFGVLGVGVLSASSPEPREGASTRVAAVDCCADWGV
jgi:hypothetical protein